jgi:Holliday junction resolvase RusA-like endonuclease
MDAPDEIARKARLHGGWVERTILGLLEDHVNALTVVVPILPPSTNHLYKAVPRRRSKAQGGGVYMGKELSEQAVAFQKLAIYEARITAGLTKWQLPDGPLKLTILITFGSRHRQDVGNREKAATDALALALGFDDSRVEELHIKKVGVDPKRPLCEMILEAINAH